MPVESLNGAAQNYIGTQRDRVQMNVANKQQFIGGLGQAARGVVGTLQDQESKAKIQQALTDAGLDPAIAEAGPGAAVDAILSKQRTDLAKLKDQMDRQQVLEGDQQFQELTKPGVGVTGSPSVASQLPIPGAGIGAVSATQSLVGARAGGAAKPMQRGVVEQASEFVGGMQPPEPKPWQPMSREDQIRFARDRHAAVSGPGETPLTPEQLAEIERAKARGRAQGTAEGAPVTQKPWEAMSREEQIAFERDMAGARQGPVETLEQKVARIEAEASARARGAAAGTPKKDPTTEQRLEEEWQQILAALEPIERAELENIQASHDSFGQAANAKRRKELITKALTKAPVVPPAPGNAQQGLTPEPPAANDPPPQMPPDPKDATTEQLKAYAEWKKRNPGK